MKKRIEILLMKHYGYSKLEAEETAKDLSCFKDHDLCNAVRLWVDEGKKVDVNAGNFSISGLMKSYSFEYPAALIFIDWYRNEPKEAEDSLLWMS